MTEQEQIADLTAQVASLVATRDIVNGMLVSNLSEMTLLALNVANILRLPPETPVRLLPGHATMIMAELQRRRDQAP